MPAVRRKIKKIANLLCVKDAAITFVRCVRAIRAFRPDVIIGFGGFASCFPLLIGRLMGIDCYLHEQNILPGKITRIFSRFAKKIFVSFEETRQYLPACARGRVSVTGNPLRSMIRQKIDRSQAIAELGLSPDRFTILILGGSQGAHALNVACCDTMLAFGQHNGIQVLHQTGTSDLDWVKNKYWENGIRGMSFAFYQDMRLLYCAADMVVSRSGATAIAEMMYYRLASVLVPFPFAAADHQKINAVYCQNRGIAVCLEEKDITPEKLWKSILDVKSRVEAGDFAASFDALGDSRAEKLVADAVLGGGR